MSAETSNIEQEKVKVNVWLSLEEGVEVKEEGSIFMFRTRSNKNFPKHDRRELMTYLEGCIENYFNK